MGSVRRSKNCSRSGRGIRVLKPNVTVLDITMPGMSGLEVASSISELGSRVLMFTMHESEHLATEVAQAGAQGFVLKSQAGKDLIRAIERLLGGGTFFGSESNPQQNNSPSEPSSGRLAEQSLAGRSFTVSGLSFKLRCHGSRQSCKYVRFPILCSSTLECRASTELKQP